MDPRSPAELSGPDTPATHTSAITATHPRPWMTAPMVSPVPPPSSTAALTRLTRVRYGPPVSARVPSSPPMAGSTPIDPRPAANAADSGPQIATAPPAVFPLKYQNATWFPPERIRPPNGAPPRRAHCRCLHDHGYF